MPIHKKTPDSMKECVGPECSGCSSANCYAEGGSVESWTKRDDNERGINKKSMSNPGRSEAGVALHPSYSVREDIDTMVAKDKHKKTLGEMKSMKKPNLYAEGGEVDMGEDQFAEPEHPEHEDAEHELHGMLGDELMSAFESKDKKRIMESLEAVVLSCMNKEHDDV